MQQDALSYERNDVLVRFRWTIVRYHPYPLLERRTARDEPFRVLVDLEAPDRFDDPTLPELQRRFAAFVAASREALGLPAKPGEPTESG